MIDYVERHWRGSLSLKDTLAGGFWVIPTLALIYYILARHGYPTSWSASGQLYDAFLILSLINGLWLWLMVGIIRKNNNRAIKTLLGVTACLGVFLSLGKFYYADLYHRKIGAIDTRVSGDWILVKGGFRSAGDTAGRVLTYSDLKGLRVLEVNSRGGNMDDSYAIAKMVKDMGLITYTDGECYSACTVIFLAGREKYVGPNGDLGFHAPYISNPFLKYYDPEVVTRDLEPALKQYATLLRDNGLSEEFIATVLDKGRKQLYHATASEVGAIAGEPQGRPIQQSWRK